jgi:hypothetical protein
MRFRNLHVDPFESESFSCAELAKPSNKIDEGSTTKQAPSLLGSRRPIEVVEMFSIYDVTAQ